jgi:DNA adenine methylase
MEHIIQKNGTLWDDGATCEYREPFFGAGAIGFRVLRQLPPECPVWLNDKDYGLACLWQTVANTPQELCELIMGFVPTVNAYEEFKATDGDVESDSVVVGFRKLALHQMSFSGLGWKSGGPLGGKTQQRSEYSIGCRWSSTTLCKHVWAAHRVFQRFKWKLKITSKDFAHCFGPSQHPVFLYCDPPYYDKGGKLYRYSMSEKDHDRLADCCHKTRHRWCVSYDKHPEILRRYEPYKITEIPVKYTAAESREVRRKNCEILITDCVDA